MVRAQRSANGYREYEESELRVVREIRALLDVGFGLDDVRPFVALPPGPATRPATSARTLVLVLRRKIVEVDAVIDRLGAVRQQLHSQLTQAIAHREKTCPRRRK